MSKPDITNLLENLICSLNISEMLIMPFVDLCVLHWLYLRQTFTINASVKDQLNMEALCWEFQEKGQNTWQLHKSLQRCQESMTKVSIFCQYPRHCTLMSGNNENGLFLSVSFWSIKNFRLWVSFLLGDYFQSEEVPSFNWSLH